MPNQKGNIVFVLIILGVVTVAMVAGGVGYFVTQKPMQKEEQKQEKQINQQQQIQQEQQKSITEITEQKTEQPEVNGKVTSLANIRSCEQKKSADNKSINDEDLARLGIYQYIEDGYRVEDMCFEDENVGFILTKKILNRYIEEQNVSVCENWCDKNIFGVIGSTNNKNKINDSKIQLGIYSESYSSFCQIDKLLLEENLSEAEILFYCGTGESGGFSWWRQYNFNDDSIMKVQDLVSLGDNYDDDYRIFSEMTLKLFRNKNRGDIYK